MTRFHSSYVALVLSLGVAGCATSSGAPAKLIAQPDIAAAYIPLHARVHLGIDTADGAAVVIAPGIAVTNAHNDNLVNPKAILGFGSLSDLMFFRTARKAVTQTAIPALGESVTAYGQAGVAELRVAHGVICEIAHAAGFADSPYFVFAGNAGPGFSGGPVLNAEGQLIGITWGYLDDAKDRRLMFAYDMKRIWAEYHLMKPKEYDPGDGDTSPSADGACDQLPHRPAR